MGHEKAASARLLSAIGCGWAEGCGGRDNHDWQHRTRSEPAGTLPESSKQNLMRISFWGSGPLGGTVGAARVRGRKLAEEVRVVGQYAREAQCQVKPPAVP